MHIQVHTFRSRELVFLVVKHHMAHIHDNYLFTRIHTGYHTVGSKISFGWLHGWCLVGLRTFLCIAVANGGVKIEPAVAGKIYLYPCVCLVGIIPVPAFVFIAAVYS